MEEFYFYTKGLTVGYHGVPLIKDIELCLKKGEIMTLIGPNGAGKTTILKSIIRQLKPLGGVACLDGSSMEKLTGKELSQKLSVVLTERVRPEMMTCKDVVATGRYPYTGKFGILSEKDWAIVQESMELVHIEELAGRDSPRPVTDRSSGSCWRELYVSSRISLCWMSLRLFCTFAISWNFYRSSRTCPVPDICLLSCLCMSWIWQEGFLTRSLVFMETGWIVLAHRRRFLQTATYRSSMV